MQLVCFAAQTIKSPCGMLMSSILQLGIPLILYDLCAQQTAGSLAKGLARLAENMMGVLICQQVVPPNDGRTHGPVECSSEWVGCGTTVWAHPTVSSSAPPSEWAVASQKSLSFFSTICSRSGPSTERNSQPAQSPTWLPPHLLTLEIWAKIMEKIIRAWCRQVRPLTWHLTCSFFFFNESEYKQIRQCRLHFGLNNYLRRSKKCMVNFLATLNRWLNTLEDTHVMLKACYCVTTDLLPGLVIGGGHQSRTKIRGIIWEVRNVCPDVFFFNLSHSCDYDITGILFGNFVTYRISLGLQSKHN